MKTKIKFSADEIEQIFEQTHPDWKDMINCIVCLVPPKDIYGSVYSIDKDLTHIGEGIRCNRTLYVYKYNYCDPDKWFEDTCIGYTIAKDTR